MTGSAIVGVEARRVWDSRGRPTLEVEVATAAGAVGRAIAPAGASRGSHEAADLRDGGNRLGGYDVLDAAARTTSVVRTALLGLDVLDQVTADAVLDQLDPSPTRSSLGGNVTVATSLAVLHAAAAVTSRPVWACLNEAPRYIPRPEVQIIGGGAHAGRRIDIQDMMVIPMSAVTIEEALRHVAEVYLRVGEILSDDGVLYGVADEGGYWPSGGRVEGAIELVLRGIERAGLTPGVDVSISLDVAASEFEVDGKYVLAAAGAEYGRSEWIEVLDGWMRRYPIRALEDPTSERDIEGMTEATTRFGGKALIIGDDLLVTDASRVRYASGQGACNAVLLKPNQAGTVSSAAAAREAAQGAGWATVVSARSGETEDVSVSHLAVGWQSELLKVGSIARGERTAKWNELLRIDAALGGAAPLAPFPGVHV